MANITLSFTTTAKQDAKLAKVLAKVNSDRVANQLDPFNTIQDYFRFVIISAVISYVKQQDDVDGGTIEAAYLTASASVQSQVEALLGVTL